MQKECNSAYEPFACKTCGTGVDACMALRGQRPSQFCCSACAEVGSHYDHIFTPPRSDSPS